MNSKILQLFIASQLFVVLILSQPPSSGGSCQGQHNCNGVCGDNVQGKYQEIEDGNNRIIYTNAVPSHTYHHDRAQINPNKVCEQFTKMTVPLNPSKQSSPTATGMGVIGILKTGAFLFNHLASPNPPNDVANHPDNEQPSLDGCAGHATKFCQYHYHEVKKLATCTHDNKWDECEWIGTMVDGFKLYSHCKKDNNYLKSCYSMKSGQSGGESTTDYEYIQNSSCHLDEANGYDFTGKGITDPSGNEITGYGYIASESYPYIMAYLYGSVNCDNFLTTDTYEGGDTNNNFAILNQYSFICVILIVITIIFF